MEALEPGNLDRSEFVLRRGELFSVPLQSFLVISMRNTRLIVTEPPGVICVCSVAILGRDCKDGAVHRPSLEVECGNRVGCGMLSLADPPQVFLYIESR